MSYKSPVSISFDDDFVSKIATQIKDCHETQIMATINQYVSVDKEELIKALNYDRQQYEKGYQEGHIDGVLQAEKLYARPIGKWIKEDDEHLKGWYRCSECGRRVEDLTDDIVIHAGCEDYTVADIYPYCHCGAKMQTTENN